MGKVKQLKNKPKENSEPGDVANMEWALAKFEAECFQLLGARLMDWFEIEENEVGFFWVDFGERSAKLFLDDEREFLIEGEDFDELAQNFGRLIGNERITA